MPEGLSAEEARVVRAAIRKHLGHEVEEIRKLVGPAGRRVFFVRLPDRQVVLKVLNVRKSRSVGCDFAVAALRRVGVPTPEVLAVDRTGRYEGEFFEYPFLILERAEGLPLDRWLLEHKPEVRARDLVLRRVGENLRRIHSVRVPSGWGAINDQGVGRFGSWQECLEKRFVRRASGAMVRPLETGWLESEGRLSAGSRAALDRLFEPGQAAFEVDHAMLVHNDLTLKHVFIDPEQLQVTAIIDLHNALAGDPVLDLARFHYFYRGRGYLRALREGYGKVGPDFERRRRLLLLVVLLEKATWLRGREERFPGRLERDLDLLEETLAKLT